MQSKEFHTFFFCMFYLFQTSRHFGFRTAIDNHCFFCSQTACSTYRVHRSITATNNRHTLTECDRSIRIFAGSIHQVYTSQILVRRHDIDRVFTRNIHKVRQTCSRSYENTLVTFLLQIFYTDGLTHNTVFYKLYTHLRKIVNFYIYNLVRQTEFRNTIFQYTTNFVQCFEYSHIVSQLSHITGKRQTGRSRTNHRYLNTVLCSNLRNGNLSAFTFIVSCKTFQITDSHSFVSHLQVNTLRFTLFFLRTHTSTHSRQCTGLLQSTCSFEEFSTLYVFDKCRNIDTHRTTLHTRRICTVQTTFSFCYSLFLAQSQVYFFFTAV